MPKSISNHTTALSPFRFLIQCLKTQPYLFIFQGMFCIVWSLKETLYPYIIKRILDHYTLSHHSTAIINGFILLVIVWASMEIAMRIQGWISASSFPRLRTYVREYCLKRCIEAEYQNHYASLGQLNDHTSKLPDACCAALEIILLHAISIGAALCFSVLLLSQCHWLFSVLLLLFIYFYYLASYLMNRRINSEGYAARFAQASTAHCIHDQLRNRQIIKWFSSEKFEYNYTRVYSKNEIHRQTLAQRAIEYMRGIQGIIAIIYLCLSNSLLVYFWQRGILQPGDLMLVPILSFSALGMSWWFTLQLNFLYREIAQIKVSLDFFNMLKVTKTSITTVLHLSPSLHCENICYGFTDHLLFKGASLRRDRPGIIGIAGLSGTGKSTFIKLLTGMLTPHSGSISLGGTVLSEETRNSLIPKILVIPQEPVIFNRSIQDNISYPKINADDALINEALQRSCCTEFVSKLPQGEQTIIGDGGHPLSLGQTQRILIARALFHKPSIIILDEPTASLDYHTENKLMRNLKQYLTSSLMLIISHRFSIFAYADEAYHLKEGLLIKDISLITLAQKMQATMDIA